MAVGEPCAPVLNLLISQDAVDGVSTAPRLASPRLLKFSTSADKKSDKRNGNDHDDDKSMMEKVKETVHASVDKSYEQLQKVTLPTDVEVI
ncbi:hypothetical protein B5M09_011293 [Aphanomyces astaci]|uniref:Uncharacterized protein n=1 Tax=Aphanomyces astaci TaxID=112090 RepID=A0A425CRN8_APHAT|nr:hypothetical protein B5M09_011293 [Aphanomyces astaci]